MGIFDEIPLTNAELIAEGLPLPNLLSIYDIATFWSDDKKRQDRLMEAMQHAFETGKLKGQKDLEAAYWNEGVISPYTFYEEIVINVHDFLTWLEGAGEPRPTECRLERWYDRLPTTDSNTTETKSKSEPRELTKWLYDAWIAEDKPGGTAFFDSLKKYKNQKGSPIVDHWTASKDGAGLRWNTNGATGTMTKKSIQNIASKFKNKPQTNTVKQK